MPWLPPYLGTWDQLIKELLHDPFLGSGRGGIVPTTHSDSPEMLRLHKHLAGSDPMPGVVSSLIGLVSLKQTASELPNGATKTGLIGSIGSSIAAEIDDICPPFRPWPWPGPPPWVFAVASTLTFVANTLQEGALQKELMATAKQVLQRGLEASKRE
jgi:hypothetical protein